MSDVRPAKRKYTANQYRRFKRLVDLNSSRVQMDRINATLGWRKLLDEVGRPVCDEMWTRWKKENDDD